MSEEFDFVAESYRLEEQYFWYREGADVLCMIALACAHRQVVPEWAAIEFVRLYRLGRAGDIASWDDVFGPPWGTGYRKGAWTHATGPAAFVAVHDEVARVAKLLGGVVPPINNTLFARVAEKFPFGRSTLAKLYAPFARAIPDWAGKMGPIRVHGLAARVDDDKPRAEIEYDLNNIEQLALYIARFRRVPSVDVAFEIATAIRAAAATDQRPVDRHYVREWLRVSPRSVVAPPLIPNGKG